MLRPSEIFSRVYWMAASMVLFPADLPTMSRASRMGTPEATIVPIVRVNLATATLRMRVPTTGTLRMKASNICRPRLDA